MPFPTLHNWSSHLHLVFLRTGFLRQFNISHGALYNIDYIRELNICHNEVRECLDSGILDHSSQIAFETNFSSFG